MMNWACRLTAELCWGGSPVGNQNFILLRTLFSLQMWKWSQWGPKSIAVFICDLRTFFPFVHVMFLVQWPEETFTLQTLQGKVLTRRALVGRRDTDVVVCSTATISVQPEWAFNAATRLTTEAARISSVCNRPIGNVSKIPTKSIIVQQPHRAALR